MNAWLYTKNTENLNAFQGGFACFSGWRMEKNATGVPHIGCCKKNISANAFVEHSTTVLTSGPKNRRHSPSPPPARRRESRFLPESRKSHRKKSIGKISPEITEQGERKRTARLSTNRARDAGPTPVAHHFHTQKLPHMCKPLVRGARPPRVIGSKPPTPCRPISSSRASAMR